MRVTFSLDFFADCLFGYIVICKCKFKKTLYALQKRIWRVVSPERWKRTIWSVFDLAAQFDQSTWIQTHDGCFWNCNTILVFKRSFTTRSWNDSHRYCPFWYRFLTFFLDHSLYFPWKFHQLHWCGCCTQLFHLGIFYLHIACSTAHELDFTKASRFMICHQSICIRFRLQFFPAEQQTVQPSFVQRKLKANKKAKHGTVQQALISAWTKRKSERAYEIERTSKKKQCKIQQ